MMNLEAFNVPSITTYLGTSLPLPFIIGSTGAEHGKATVTTKKKKITSPKYLLHIFSPSNFISPPKYTPARSNNAFMHQCVQTDCRKPLLASVGEPSLCPSLPYVHGQGTAIADAIASRHPPLSFSWG